MIRMKLQHENIMIQNHTYEKNIAVYISTILTLACRFWQSPKNVMSVRALHSYTSVHNNKAQDQPSYSCCPIYTSCIHDNWTTTPHCCHCLNKHCFLELNTTEMTPTFNYIHCSDKYLIVLINESGQTATCICWL